MNAIYINNFKHFFQIVKYSAIIFFLPWIKLTAIAHVQGDFLITLHMLR